MIEPTISFRLRIRKSDRIFNGKKELRARTRMLCIIFTHFKLGQTKILSGRRWIWGRSVYVSALRLEDGEIIIIGVAS